MSRWGKNIVVPLDSLCKEKENTNRPTVARSVGTVGKWGKMGFTSTRTYALAALPATLPAASPGESPSSALDFDMSPSVPDPPKPKKFFKSINTTTPEVIAQIIQHIPNVAPNSPMRDAPLSHSHVHVRHQLPQKSRTSDSIKIKVPKKSPSERKKKPVAPKTPKATRTPSIKSGDGHMSDASADNNSVRVPEVKSSNSKKKKELKPEAPPSRVLGRARKTVNYCEEEDDERILLASLKDIVIHNSTEETATSIESRSRRESLEKALPILSPTHGVIATAAAVNLTPKAPEHKPIVLRISKGTSRLVDTNVDDAAQTSSPDHDNSSSNNTNIAVNSSGSFIGVTDNTTISTPQKSLEETNIVNETLDLLRPPAAPAPISVPAPLILDELVHNGNEINYSNVKISPDKPPKERLKLIIKTDVIRNAIAAAAAAAAANKESSNLVENSNNNNNNNSNNSINTEIIKKQQQQQQAQPIQKPEKEKKKGKHKHKTKQQQQQLTPQICEFKAPSPNIISNTIHTNGSETSTRTVISPAVLSERDFDSQSSVLGSISSKGNSTPHMVAHTGVQEDSYVVHSRGSSVITSDLETSQHSSLVAPPSDIELRLESMMMDGSDTGEASQAATINIDEPLQEDILSVLRGDEGTPNCTPLINGKNANVENEPENKLKQRGKRGRGRPGTKRTHNVESEHVAVEVQQKTKRVRNKKAETANVAVEEQATGAIASPPALTVNRRGRPAKKLEETTETLAAKISNNAKEIKNAIKNLGTIANAIQEDLLPSNTTTTTTDIKEAALSVGVATTRRGRPSRSTRNNACNYNNNNSSNNNNNINNIAANLSAKAEAQNTEATATTTTVNIIPSTISTTRSYGRKRKNQQVMQVLQPPTAEELEEEQPNSAKISAISSNDNGQNSTASANALSTNIAHSTNNPNINSSNNNNSNTSPPRHDYKVKDKFKRTIMLDNNPGSCDTVIAMTNYEQQHDSASSGGEEHQQQRAAVKLVISKKKGSIFKSRTLVPSHQNTDAVTKRHLYKHSWNHDVGGDNTTRDEQNALDEMSVGSKTTNAAKELYDHDFDDNDDDDDDDGNEHECHANVDGGGNNNSMETNATSGAGASINNLGSNSAFSMDVDELSRNSASNASGGNADGGKRKDFYTVVRNVKTAHQIQEIGEYQEMNDDVQYILDALQPQNPMSTRVLSALQLASKCMNSAFRMHVRSHDVVTKFFKALSDANKDLSLGLCTSAVMYILSQEGLNMDLDRDSLELMMNLLEAETMAAPADHATYERNQQKVRELCEEIKAQGKATHLNVDTITVGTLAMETLLSLTSKRAGDWFKEELRELGGLEHIIKTITDCSRPVIKLFDVMPTITWTGALHDSMKTVERCMRVLENVTQMNEENQKYILKYEEGAMVNTLATLYKLCERELLRHPTTEITEKDHTGVVLRELLMPLMKVLINLTHSFRKNSTPGAEVLGKRIDVFHTSFHLLLRTSNYIPERLVFELNILVLLLLINLTMYSKINRTRVIQAQAPTPYNDTQDNSTVSAVEAIMQYFYKCEELARLVEKNTDAMLDNTDKDKKKQEEVDETVNNLIQKAGHHMEHTLKGSYAGIFIGHIISDNEENEMIVRRYLHGNGFKEIVNVLEKYYTFMNLTASSDAFTLAHIKSTKQLIDYYKRRDLIFAEMGDDNLPLNLDTSISSTYDNNVASTSAAASSTRGGTQRVYKTYSSQR